MKTAKAKAKAKPAKLPFGLIADDLTYPKGKERLASDVGSYGNLKLYEVDNHKGGTFWIVCTLHIANGRRGQPDRTYGMRCDTKTVVRAGQGPHVLRTVNVYVRQSRTKALAELIELWTKGMANAGTIRDRVSSRRAQGQLERAQGHTSWLWDR